MSALNLSLADENISCCIRSSSSVDIPLSLFCFRSRVYTMLVSAGILTENQSEGVEPTFCISLNSSATASTSGTYSGNPSSLSAFSTCSTAMVFLASFSEMSFASEEIKVMNSMQHSMRRSRASRAKVWPLEAGRISPMILKTVARGRVSPCLIRRYGVQRM